MDIEVEIINGRLFISSKTTKGSEQLTKWIKENKQFFNKFCDIEIHGDIVQKTVKPTLADLDHRDVTGYPVIEKGTK